MSETGRTAQRAQFLAQLDGMDDAAIETLDASLSAEAETESRIRRAFLKLRRDDTRGAQELLDSSGVADDDPFAAMARASLAAAHGRFEDALTFAGYAAELPYMRADALLVRAVALSNLGRFQELAGTPDDDSLEDSARGSLMAIKAFALQSLGAGARARELLLQARRFLPDLVGFSEQLTALRESSLGGAPRCVRL